jgi:chromosome segregation ATPase
VVVTDRIVYLDCQENGDPVVDEEGIVYGSISASSPSSAPTVRAYVPAEELDKATSALAQRDERIAELEQKLVRLSDDARMLVHGLESVVIQRDKRIAELEKHLEDANDDAAHGASEVADLLRGLAIAQSRIAELETRATDLESAEPRRGKLARRIVLARAEVPEWCKEFIRTVRRSWLLLPDNGVGVEIDRDAIDRALESMTNNQLRACGIDVP